MPTLLYDLKSNRLMNKTIFIHHLKVYDNAMVLERRKFPFKKEEITISYSHVSQVNLMRNLFFGHLEIINTGGVENIIIRYVSIKSGRAAKKIIDAKIHTTHGPYTPQKQTGEPGYQSDHLTDQRESIIDDKALIRYKDLLNQGRITKIEYNKLLQKHLRR